MNESFIFPDCVYNKIDPETPLNLTKGDRIMFQMMEYEVEFVQIKIIDGAKGLRCAERTYYLKNVRCI